MKTYHNHRVEPYFTFLKNGQKTIEGRLQKGKYSLIKPGDYITVYNKDETDHVETIVVDVRKYRSIAEMLKTEQLKKMLPDVKTVDEGMQRYRDIYTKEDEEKYGAVAIEIKLVK